MVDISKTREDLIFRAATEVGALASGQSLSAEDYDTIDNLVDPLCQQLSFDGVAHVQDTNAIQLEHFIPLARLLANEAAISFGQAYSRDVKISNETILLRLTAMRPTYETLENDYF
jgi:hypothetical protein